MVGKYEIEKLSKELNIDCSEIIEVFRDQIAEYYNADWIRFTKDNSIILVNFNNKKRTLDSKKIFVKRTYFKKIVEKTIDMLYKDLEKHNLKKLRNKLNLKRIEGIFKPEKQSILFYKKGVLQRDIIGKLDNKFITKELENKFTLYKILGETIRKKDNLYIVNCIPNNIKKKENK